MTSIVMGYAFRRSQIMDAVLISVLKLLVAGDLSRVISSCIPLCHRCEALEGARFQFLAFTVAGDVSLNPLICV